jgi:hypothetical protein
VTIGVNERRPIVCSISCATITSLRAVAAGFGRERHADRVADAFLQQHAIAAVDATMPFEPMPASVRPRMQRVVAARAELAIDRDQVLHAATLQEDDRSPAQAELSARARFPAENHQRLAHARFGRQRSRRARVVVHHPREQVGVEAAPVDADAHGLPSASPARSSANCDVVLRALADVAGLIRYLASASRTRMLGAAACAVVVEIRRSAVRRTPPRRARRESCGTAAGGPSDVFHGHAHQLRSCFGERAALRDRAAMIARLSVLDSIWTTIRASPPMRSRCTIGGKVGATLAALGSIAASFSGLLAPTANTRGIRVASPSSRSRGAARRSR